MGVGGGKAVSVGVGSTGGCVGVGADVAVSVGVGVSVAGDIALNAFSAGGDAAGDFQFTLVTFDFSNESQSDTVRGSFAGELCDFDPDDVGFEDPCP